MDRHAERDRLDLAERPAGVAAQVGLREHDRGGRAAVPGQREVALEAARVQVARHRRDEQDGVDVGREDLLDRLEPGALAGEGRAAREHGLDAGAVAVEARADPVADGRRRARAKEAPGRLRPELAGLGEDDVGAAVLHGDARGHEPGVAVEAVVEERAPAELVEGESGQGGSPLSASGRGGGPQAGYAALVRTSAPSACGRSGLQSSCPRTSSADDGTDAG